KTMGGFFIGGNWGWNLVKGGYERITRLHLPNPGAGWKSLVDERSTALLGDPRRQRFLPGLVTPRAAPAAPTTPTVAVETKHALGASIDVDVDEEVLRLTLPVVGGANVRYVGADAEAMAPKLLAKVNRSGGRKEDERLAVEMLERVADDRAPDLFQGLLRRYAAKTSQAKPVKELGGSLKLALEMALHEQRERELLAGELLDLENAWREAEELARIADSLGSSAIDRALARLKAQLAG
ncbi:MAG TPA: hypothetical protein VIK25_13550, partial [Gemmatimonadaceae bacterium]